MKSKASLPLTLPPLGKSCTDVSGVCNHASHMCATAGYLAARSHSCTAKVWRLLEVCDEA